MTTREFYSAVAQSDLSAEIVEKAQELIASMDAKNEKRKTTETKEKKEAAARREAVLSFFYSNTDKPMTRDEIAVALNITPGQVTAAVKPLIADQMIVKAEAKIGKSRKIVYTMPHEE